jgi:hypothetical protein
MESAQWTYHQFRKTHDYPIYVRLAAEAPTAKLTHLLTELGFTALSDADAKKIPLHRPNTRILSVQEASARLQREISGSELLDRYGAESLSLQGGMPVYTYRKVGLMGLPFGKTFWELAVHPELAHTDQMVGLRVVLVRFLAQALSYDGVLCYWGIVKDDAVIVMKQAQSFGEAVLIDVKRRVVFSNGGELRIGTGLKVIRKDKETRTPSQMSREDLIGFLSVSTCLLSFTGVTPMMKKAIYDLSTNATGAYAVTEATANL